MAAGQGFKTFTTGEVLTAGDVNGYLMQGINVFTNATARDAAITAPAEGQFAFTKDNNSLWYYDGAAWVASGATGDIEGVTATSPLTGGGTSGTVTVGIQNASTSQRGSVQLSDSTSTTDSTLAATSTAVKSAYDLANGAIPKSTVTTNGDLIYGTGSGTVTRRGIGSTGQVLTVSGGVPTWATASSGGMTVLASGSMSGTTLSLSSISQSYKNLQLVLDGATWATGTDHLAFRFNGITSSSYRTIITASNSGATYNTVLDASYDTRNRIYLASQVNNTNGLNQTVLNIYNYTSSNSQMICQWMQNFTVSGNNYFGSGMMSLNALSSGISTIDIFTNGGGYNFNGGTYTLYGVN